MSISAQAQLSSHKIKYITLNFVKQRKQCRYFLTFKEPKNRFQGIDSASLWAVVYKFGLWLHSHLLYTVISANPNNPTSYELIYTQSQALIIWVSSLDCNCH